MRKVMGKVMGNMAIPRHQRPAGLDSFLFGVPYYPEHWSDVERTEDANRMAAAGVNVVRMAEFAWDRIEPLRGSFDFALFDETIARLGEAGISTILCTPTATPPRWLTAGHDDWMRVDEDGRRMAHGSRQHCCTNNEAFQAESRRISKVMAEHYCDNPNVLGWQTDNEFFCHFHRCYCPACQGGFRSWLKNKYANIDSLNAAWGTSFWALTYNDFEQIPLPYPAGRPAVPNPSHELDYYRYISDAVIEFQRQQVEILRAANPKWFVTHNIVDVLIDYWRFTADLDFLSVDIYPGFGDRAPEAAALSNELCRSSSGSYMVPEQESGPGAQRAFTVHKTPAPGRMRLWAYQSIAHGADGILHFRWRTCRFGGETYWHGVIDHDDIPRRRYEELAREGRELKRVGPRIIGTVLSVAAGVLTETDQLAAHQTMSLGLPSVKEQRDLAYRQLWGRHLPCGLIQAADSFDGLKLLVVPSMPLMDEDLAGRLAAFVEAGGVLVVTARSAIRDRNNHAISQTPPGLLRELCGVGVEEFGRLDEGELVFELGGTQVASGQCYEILSPSGADPVSLWCGPADDRPCSSAGRPAVAVNKIGRGCAIYVGTYLSEGNAGDIFDFALARADIAPLAGSGAGVEITRRHGQGRELVFVLNHNAQPAAVTNLPAGIDLLTEKRCDGQMTLEPYGVAIIEQHQPAIS